MALNIGFRPGDSKPAPVREIELHRIKVPKNRLRRFRPGLVEDLAESMARVGLIESIIVRPRGRGYLLVAGRHRLEAARMLGWPTITCIVRKLSDDEARLAEIDSNLCVAYLGPAETAALAAKLAALE